MNVDNASLLRDRSLSSSLSQRTTVILGKVRRVRSSIMFDDSSSGPSTQPFSSKDAFSNPSIPEDASTMPAEGKKSDVEALKAAFLKPLNILLFVIPPAIASQYCGWDVSWVFSLNFLAILPLAGLLGGATEELAMEVGEVVGALVNATFGNAVEMIMAVFALQAGLIRVVQGSLLGSILSNLLLVLGMCFFFGGYYKHVQKFNPSQARSQGALLLLAVLAMAMPTLIVMGRHDGQPSKVISVSELSISRGSAIVLAIIYVLYLIFQLHTHPDKFASVSSNEDGENEEEEATMSVCCSATLLFVSTMFVAWCSEGLVNSIEGVTESLGISQSFIGIVLLPIVGNACEHLTAVTVALKDKMDLSIGVALGSSTQIALFVVPFMVICGWIMDILMGLNFYPMETGILLLTVLIVCFLTGDGESTWMEAAMLIAAYIMIAVAFWFVK